MRAYIILHTMVIDDERDDDYDDNYHNVASVVATPVIYETPASLNHFSKGDVFDFWIDVFESSIRLDIIL
jgi:hypothetical protein